MERIKANNRIREAISILQQQAKFPVLVQKKIDESAEKILELIESFLRGVEYSVLHLLCDNCGELESDRDSEYSIEFAIRCFPRVLSTKFKLGRSFSTYYAIMLHAQPEFTRGSRNANCISLVPLLARLGHELGQFEKNERGGLFLKDMWSGNNVLQMLAATNLSHHTFYYSEHHQMVDDLYLDAIKKLRAMGLLKKEDVRENVMLHRMCNYLVLPRKRFIYLVDWDPAALSQPDAHGRIPLHYWANTSTILGLDDFRIVLKAGLRHFPNKEGISFLFQKDNKGSTPFQLACKPSLFHLDSKDKRTVKEVTEGIDHLVHPETFLFACENERVHVDGVYFLLRRQPQLLLSGAKTECSVLSTEEESAKTREIQKQGHRRAQPCQNRERKERKKRKTDVFESSINQHSKRRRRTSILGRNKTVLFRGT
eukprot:jgi/Psemu1/250426/estExt_Genewise1Plus.C_160140